MMELRDIPGYEGLYAATSEGHIWSYPKSWVSGNGGVRKHGGQFLRADIGTQGYRRVTLVKDGKTKRFLLHRLVAAAWVPNPDNKPFVNHKDGVKYNNAPDNIEWCTQGENERHAWATGLKKDTPERGLQRRAVAIAVNASRRKLTMDQANEVRVKRAQGASWSELSRQFGIHRNGLKSIVAGESYVQ